MNNITLNIKEIPTKSTMWNIENESYETKPKSVVDNWKLIQPYSKGIKAYVKDNIVIVGVRGTADMRDIKADLQIINSGVKNSSRYREDVKTLRDIQVAYPPSKYAYYGVGHSLGGAILDELIDSGFIISGISYNPAVDLMKFRNSTKNLRIYNESDPLFNLMGRFTKGYELRKNKLGWKGRLANLIPLGRLGNSLNAHLLSNFVGGFHLILN